MEYLNEFEVAEYLKCSVGTIRSWRYKGIMLPYMKTVANRKGMVRYRMEDIDKWMEQHMVMPTDAKPNPYEWEPNKRVQDVAMVIKPVVPSPGYPAARLPLEKV